MVGRPTGQWPHYGLRDWRYGQGVKHALSLCLLSYVATALVGRSRRRGGSVHSAAVAPVLRPVELLVLLAAVPGAAAACTHLEAAPTLIAVPVLTCSLLFPCIPRRRRSAGIITGRNGGGGGARHERGRPLLLRPGSPTLLRHGLGRTVGGRGADLKRPWERAGSLYVVYWDPLACP